MQRVHDRRVHNRLQFGSALGISVGLILTLSIFTGLFGRVPLRLSDLLYQLYPPSNQVILITIDDNSLKAVGPLPWQRSTIAELVRRVAQANPRVIGLDLILVDSTDQDKSLAQALAQSPQVIQPVIGVDATRLSNSSAAPPNFGLVLKPTAMLITPNTQLGHSMFTPDSDGILRHASTVIQENGYNYSALGILALRFAQRNPQSRRWEDINNEGRMLINFFDLHSITLPAADILEGRANGNQLRDKIVLIGPSGNARTLTYQAPVSEPQLSSTEVQANLIETFLSQRTLTDQDALNQVVMIFLLAILAGATLPHFRLLTQVGLVIIYYMLYLGYAFSMFDLGIVVQPLYPALALFVTLGGTALFRYFSEERNRMFVTTLLRRYVAPEEVAQLTNHFEQGPLHLDGVHREVSVLALDLSDLEGLADSLSSHALIKLLDQYVSLAVDVIFQYDGAIVKHTGSAILAAWNLWSDQTDHASIAVRTAVEIKHELAEFNRTHPKELTIRSGIGVATGNIVAGRIGARHRAEYAIIGEVVGMAERIALKPERGVFIDVTTRERIGDEFDLVEVRPVRLRRKTDALNVWQLVVTSESTREIIHEPEKEIANVTITTNPP